MSERRPEPSRVYFDHHLDSRRWEKVPYRSGDIILATGIKVGTTWTQRVLSFLVVPELPFGQLDQTFLWIDQRFYPFPEQAIADFAAGQNHRRFFKSHVAFDALRYDPDIKYITVGRDGRDAALSAYNHWAGYTDAMHGLLNSSPDRLADPFPVAPDDVHTFIRDWLTRGNPRFPWESDGFPFWSHFHLLRSFWDQRDLPNVLLIHYQDMKANLAREVERIARFLDIPVTPAKIDEIAKRCSFDSMRRDAIEAEDAHRTAGTGRPSAFRDGARTFFNKGVSGRWKDVFNAEELALYEAVKRRHPADFMRWLEDGRIASGIDPSQSSVY